MIHLNTFLIPTNVSVTFYATFPFPCCYATNVHAPRHSKYKLLTSHRIRSSNPNSLPTRQIVHCHLFNNFKDVPLIRIIVPRPLEFLSAIARALSTNASTDPSL